MVKREEDWDEEYEVRECDHCGKTARCILTNDPYSSEIHGEETEEDWWCWDCWHERYWDI